MSKDEASLLTELDRMKNELRMAQTTRREMRENNEWRLEEMRIEHARAIDSLKAECNFRVQQAENRAIEAESGIYKLKSKVELAGLQRSLNDVEENRASLIKIIAKMHELALTAQERADITAFATNLERWIEVRDGLKRIIDTTTNEYARIIGLIRSGTPLASLQPVVIPERPPAPSVPPLPLWMKQRLQAQESALCLPASSQSTSARPIVPPYNQQLIAPPGLHHISALSQRAAPSNVDQQTRPSSSQCTASSQAPSLANSSSPLRPGNLPNTVGKIEKLYEEVGKRVVNATRDEIKMAIILAKKVAPNATFRGVPFNEVIGLVVEKLLESRRAASAVCVETSAQKLGPTAALKDDVCSICHDPLSIDRSKLLRCPTCNNHFHQQCLNKWLQLKNICPVCDRHMTADEFAAL